MGDFSYDALDLGLGFGEEDGELAAQPAIEDTVEALAAATAAIGAQAQEQARSPSQSPDAAVQAQAQVQPEGAVAYSDDDEFLAMASEPEGSDDDVFVGKGTPGARLGGVHTRAHTAPMCNE